MFRATKEESPYPTGRRTDAPATGYSDSAKESRPIKRESLSGHPVDPRDRESYYVFRQGMLMVQAFDRQSLGW
jgi:hypothetical protein